MVAVRYGRRKGGKEGTLSHAIDILQVCHPACLTTASGGLVVLPKRMRMTHSMYVR